MRGRPPSLLSNYGYTACWNTYGTVDSAHEISFQTMTTKLRSACDRCHQTKMRCSGDMPCHGCLASKSLCFYSVSSPLGRPRGSKKGQPRAGSTSNDTVPRDTASNGERTTMNLARPMAATSEQRKRSSPQHAPDRRKNRSRSSRSSESLNISMSDDQREDASSLPPTMSGTQTLVGNVTSDPSKQSRNSLTMPNVPMPNNYTMHSSTSLETGRQILANTLPHNLSDSELSNIAVYDNKN